MNSTRCDCLSSSKLRASVLPRSTNIVRSNFRRHFTTEPFTSKSQHALSSSSIGGVPFAISRRSLTLGSMTTLALPSSSSQDLLVVGPGVLGGYLGKLWKDSHPGSTVVGLTNTTNNHERLRSLGLSPITKADLPHGRKFPFVAFSAPPSGSSDYAAEVQSAVDLWEGPSSSGSFVFTSSMSVCAAEDGEQVTEDSCPLVPLGKGPSTDRLLTAEHAVIKAGGNVLRLVGLYHASRGAHTYFLKVKEVPRWGGYTVNLLHYEDAANLSLSILRGGPFHGRSFIGCDNHPVTFQDMIDSCHASGLPSLKGEVKFTQTEAESRKGKRVTNNITRQALGGWAPKYESFDAFVASGAQDFYSQTGWV